MNEENIHKLCFITDLDDGQIRCIFLEACLTPRTVHFFADKLSGELPKIYCQLHRYVLEVFYVLVVFISETHNRLPVYE